MCVRQCSKHFMCIITFNLYNDPNEIGAVFISTLEMRKLNHKTHKCFAQGHTEISMWWN